MDLIESGAIFNFKPANISRLSISGTSSVSRFEELFLSSPRAKELSSTSNVSYLSSSLPFTPRKSNPSNTSQEITRNNSVFEGSDTSLFSPAATSPDTRFDALRSQVTEVLTSLQTPKSSSYNRVQSNELQRISSVKDSSLKHVNDLGQDQISSKARDDFLDGNDKGEGSLVNGDVAEKEDDEQPNKNNQDDDDDRDDIRNIDDMANDFDDKDEEDMDIDANVLAKMIGKDEDNEDENGDNDGGDKDQPQETINKSRDPGPTALPSTDVKKPHQLSEWCIKAVKTKHGPPGIIVEGQKPENEPGCRWHSTCIVKRINACLLETKKKSQYELNGDIQEDATIAGGFSVAFVKAFKHGFPSNWEKLVQEHFDDNQSLPKEEQAAKSKAPKPKQNLTKPKKLKTKTPKNSAAPVEVELKRTSSGRLIKPPLAWWRGQRIITDGDHNLTTIDPGTEEHTALSVGLYDYDLKLPKEKASFLQSKLMTPKVAKYEISPPLKENTKKTKRTPSKSFLHKQQLLQSDDLSTSTMPNTDTTSESESKTKTDDDPSYSDSDTSDPPDKLEKIPFKKPNNYVTTKSSKAQSQKSKSPSRRMDDGVDEELNNVDDVKRNISFSDEKDSDDENSKRPSPARTRRSRLSSSDKENINRSKRPLRNNRDKDERDSDSEKVLAQRRTRRNLRQTNTNMIDSKTDDSSQEDDRRNTRRSKKATFNSKTRKQHSEFSTEEEEREPRRTNRNKSRALTRDDIQSSEDEDFYETGRRKGKTQSNKNKKKSTVDVRVKQNHTQRSKKINNRKVDMNEDVDTDESSEENKETKKSGQFKQHKNKNKSIKDTQRGKIQVTRSTKNSRTARQKEDDSSDATSQDDEQKTEGFKRPQNKQIKAIKKSAKESDFSSQDDDEDEHGLAQPNSNKQTSRTFTKLQRTNQDDNFGNQTQKTAVRNTTSNECINLRQKDRLNQMPTVCEDKEELSTDDEEEEEAIAAMVAQARQRKVQQQIQAQEEERERTVSRKKPDNNSKKKQAEIRRDDDDVGGSGWREEEILRFTTALHSIPLSSPRFWHQVSQAVETRTAQECQSKYEEQLEGRPRKEKGRPKQQQKHKQKVVAITGGVGTVKRKRELRQLIQQTNDGYDDDIFDSTPFKKSKKNYKIDLDPHSSDEDDDDYIDDDDNEAVFDEHSIRDFKTPSSRTPSSRFRPLGPGSYSSNTPTGDFISPSLLQPVDRSGMDHYIKRVKQGKRGVCAQTTKVSKTSTPKKNVPVHVPKVNTSIFDAHKAPDPDSEEESDDYFSE